MDDIGFTFIYINIYKVQITTKIYKCGDYIKQDRIKKGCVNLGGEGCLSLCKVPIGLNRVKGKCGRKDCKNP